MDREDILQNLAHVADEYAVGAAALELISRLEAEVAQLRSETLTDHLTGVGSRRAFDSRLIAEHARALRHGAPLMLVSLDADHFKRVNDEHGHAKGDEVLRAIGGALADLTRADDFAARVGGEEFAVILTGSSAAGALLFANRLRRMVQQRTRKLGVPVTISLGLAAWSPSTSSPHDLAGEADRALYAAKEAGRDRAIAAWDMEKR